MYLIDTFKRTSGIYLILNLPERKAYVGLARNMSARALDHFTAICQESLEDDNENLIREANKEFLHIPIWYGRDDVDAAYDGYLRYLESILICIMRNAGFDLYNKAKIGTDRQEIIQKYREIVLWDEETAKADYEDTVRMMRDHLLQAFRAVFQAEDLTPEKLAMMEREQLEQLWKEVAKNFAGPGHYILTKAPGEKYIQDSENYYIVSQMLSGFRISKEKLQSIGVNWESRSIFDAELRAQWGELLLVSNFGAHNGESPYEILKMMDMDIQNSEDHCCYWALRNVNELDLRNRAEKLFGKEKCPIYIVFKTTTSDNSGGKKKVDNLEKTLSEKDIRKKTKEIFAINPPDLMHSYLDGNGTWQPLPGGLSYVTIPNDEDKETKAVALRISKFWTCKEGFHFIQAEKDWIFKKDFASEENSDGISTCPTYYSHLDDQLLEEKRDKWVEQDEVGCLIARLEYPYVVVVSHTGPLSTYLSGRENAAFQPRILLEAEGIKADKRLYTAYAFRGDEVWCVDLDSDSVYKDITNETNLRLESVIMEKGRKGHFEIENTKQVEVIKIEFSDGSKKEIRLDRSCKPMDKKADVEGVVGSLDYGETKRIRYYGFPEPESGRVYAFRYIGASVRKPPFLLDETE